jgi:exopolysaccharide biosynthesis polyprenyl glycosylphosphotransferase
MKTHPPKMIRQLPLSTGTVLRGRTAPRVVPVYPVRPFTKSASRAVDVIVAIGMLAVLALPMVLVAVLVKLTSRGPALYKQQRIGLAGRPFVIYKFRTMGINAEVETGPIWAKRGDPRCTLLGHLLRRWCIDELPQLFNVLKGEMSLVGPRPERPYFVKEFSRRIPTYNQRHQVRPGMTGWAQVNGWRGDSSLDKRIEFDLHYVRHWTVWFNLRILLLTPLRLLIDRHGG